MIFEVDTQGYTITRHIYKGLEIIIKCKKNRGMKGLCIQNDKCIFNKDFSFVNTNRLLNIMHNKIDKYLSGAWVPNKVLKELNKED